jgi:glycosyltransferase involved in cell wall biosynthesis
VRIGFVCNEYPPSVCGGIGTLTQVIARSLAGAGHSVRVIGTYAAGAGGAALETDRGVVVRRRPMPEHPGAWLRARYALFRTVREWCRRGDVDVVEVPDYEGWSAGWPNLPVPVVTRLSGSGTYFAAEMGQPPHRTTRWLERAALRRADFWIAESNYVLAGTTRVFGLEPPPHAVLYNSVEVPREVPFVDRFPNRVVFAGTLTEKKGILSLVEAWGRVRAACGDAELHIYGKDGAHNGQSMQEYVRSRLCDAPEGSVRFHGHVSLERLERAFQEARVAVMPSYAEGFALAPLHAMACGCPTIFTRRSSGEELITHGRDGLLVDPTRPDEIADAIVSVLKDSAVAERLGSAGRMRILKDFSAQAWGERNDVFYTKCLADFKRRVST